MRQYLVDAFTDRVFTGNPAAVCILDGWPPDRLMQNIAKENNLSETAFAVKNGYVYDLRWFTPADEIDFCGHATLAAAFVLKNYVEPDCNVFQFSTKAGPITVHTEKDFFKMDFPAYRLNPVAVTDQMAEAVGVRPLAAFLDRDLLLVVDSEDTVRNLKIHPQALRQLDGVCVAVTAKGKGYDCVSRVFAPDLDVLEDPVTGSTHCMIVPYWARVLNKKSVTAFQASERTGVLYAELQGDRVKISGRAVLFGISEIYV